MYIYDDGKWDVHNDNLIAPLNFSFLFGCGIFDTLPIFNGKPLFIHYHYERLFNSINYFQIPFDKKEEDIESIIMEGLEKYSVEEGRIRIVVDFGTGSEDDYFKRSKNASLVILLMPAKIHKGVHKPWKLRRGWFNRSKSNIIFKHKTTSILENFISRQRLKESEFDEAIVSTDSDLLLECIFSNIFYIRNNTLYTPSLELPILNGTMRRFILEHSKKIGVKSEEVMVKTSELKDVDGLFVTNSISGVVPIESFDGQEYPTDHPLLKQMVELAEKNYFA